MYKDTRPFRSVTDQTRKEFIILLATAFIVIGRSDIGKYSDVPTFFDKVYAHLNTEDEKLLFAMTVGQKLMAEDEEYYAFEYAAEEATKKFGHSVFTMEDDLLPITTMLKELNDGDEVIPTTEGREREKEITAKEELEITV